MATERDDRDNPGVVAPPPVIYLGFLVLGGALDYLWPVGLGAGAVGVAAGAALFAIGGVIAFTAIREFRRAGTDFKTHRPSTAIVTGGLYRHSRNPIYIALALAYAGIAVAADGLWAMALLAPTLVVVHHGVIAREERYLEGKFGDEYLRYKASVRRWL